MIDKYGVSRYLRDGGAMEIDKSERGILYRKDVANDEPIVMVRVVNSTPESDGSFKEYFLRVPPTIQTARQAVAWTFEEDEQEYNPVYES